MKLEVEGGVVIEEPSAADLAREVASLEHPSNKYAILEEGNLFVQVYRDRDGTFALEYSEGSVDKMFHYESASLEQATELLQRFLRGDDYRSVVPFAPMRL
jgi:hypothetical protein